MIFTNLTGEVGISQGHFFGKFYKSIQQQPSEVSHTLVCQVSVFIFLYFVLYICIKGIKRFKIHAKLQS